MQLMLIAGANFKGGKRAEGHKRFALSQSLLFKIGAVVVAS
jgi:hypothetical protein